MKYVESLIREIPDFPKPGIKFKDITPVLSDPKAFKRVTAAMAERYKDKGIQKICAIESRGFIFGAPLAQRLNAGLVVARKPGKLPHQTRSISYQLEYGEASLEIHEDAFAKGERVLVVDDLLATGGTAGAAGKLVTMLGGRVVEYAFMIELTFLKGRAKLPKGKVFALVKY